MKKLAIGLALLIAVTGCSKQQPKASATAAQETSTATPVSGPFSSQELQNFTALDPIDTHTHVYWSTPAFYALLKRLNLHILDIVVVDDTAPRFKDIFKEKARALHVIRGSDGHMAFCTSFDPYKFDQPNFDKEAIRNLNEDFAKGAVAVKIWKNVGMEIKDKNGKYILPDNPAFQPIFQDIAAHHKTLIAHLADPDSVFKAPSPDAPDYDYIMKHPQLDMYNKPGSPTKAAILLARDHILDRNPNLRMVGAHLGSMEGNFDELAQHLDKYPNFAVDMAARMPYFEMQPRAKMIAFITKYQDRLIYGTDNTFDDGGESETLQTWEANYSDAWRYLATNDTIMYRKLKVQGLDLPPSVLRKIYHDNAVKWFPGILKTVH